ncbi:MAG: hypothetical protein FWH55_05505 [Oscillospiraceae bacterium]|nr:hypothetical protein [Oscillospiraceae bacterium]
MVENRFYIPSSEGYKIFRANYENKPKKNEDDLWESFQELTPEAQVKSINNIYKTRISSAEQELIVQKIKSLNSDKAFDCADNDYSPVDKLRRVYSARGKEKNKGYIDHFSFATKYCHHFQSNKFPIYDSVNVRVMSVYLGYKDVIEDNIRNYNEYVRVCKTFWSLIGLAKLENKDGYYVDKYIQAIGVERELLFN